MKRTFAKFGALMTTLALSVGLAVVPAIAATEQEIAAAEAGMQSLRTHGGFETGGIIAEGNTKTHAGAYSPGGDWQVGDSGCLNDFTKFAADTCATNSGDNNLRLMAVTNDTEKHPEIADMGYVLKMINPYNDPSGIDGFSLPWGVKYGIYNQLPGQTYRVSAKVYMHKGNLANDIGVFLGAGNGVTSDRMFAYKNMTGTTDTYDKWIDISFCFTGVNSQTAYNWFNIYLSTDVGERNTEGYVGHTGYVLWDDITIQTVDGLTFDEEIETVEGGKKYSASFALSNLESVTKNYTSLKAIYSNSGGVKKLEHIAVNTVTADAVTATRAGRAVENITFDLSALPQGGDYSIKAMIWEENAQMKPFLTIQAD